MMKQTLMVVDDEPDTIELAKAILDMHGFKVLAFTKSTEALAALKEGAHPDLLILDMRMPEMSGPDFCKAMRADPKLKDIKVVYFTASSDSNEAILEPYHVLGFIFKPFDNEDFVTKIKHYLK